jgi:hypothetical protein
VTGTGTFGSLVRAINSPRRDRAGRDQIKLGPRIHDSIEAVVAILVSRGELVQFDGNLAHRSAGKRQPTVISLPWLQSHLARTFQFVEQGKPVDLPPALARFILRRFEAFPEFFRSPAYDDPRRKHRRRGRPSL